MSKMMKAIVALFATATLALSPIAANAVTPGIGDHTNAVRYGSSDPLGTRITDFTGEDDTSTVVDAPFAMNFFNTKYDKLCISINGGVFPTNDSGASCAAYDEDVATLADDAASPMVAVLALDVDLSECPAGLWTDDNTNDSIDEGELNDDGFAIPCSVYWGTTTVDGHDAVVITWYRVPNNDVGNDPSLTNTFQLLLIKRGTGDATAGYDFDFEFNYATLTDDEDGYEVDENGVYNGNACTAYGNPTMDDNGTPDDYSDDTFVSANKSETYDQCRWGIGVGSYIDGEGGVGYEFFNQYSLGQIIDTGDTAMIKHHLGSTVNGRYRCGMINGVATGCDFDAALADTGVDATPLGLGALALVAAGGIAFAVRRRQA
jgi:hypothetical protein